MEISIVETRTVPTIMVRSTNREIYFHSKYDPIRESNAWTIQSSKLVNLKRANEIVIFGIGAGYHIKNIANEFPSACIKVIEFNKKLMDWFLHSPFIEDFQNNLYSHVDFTFFNNLDNLERRRLFSELPTGNLLIHNSTLDIMPEELHRVKALLEDIQFKKKSMAYQFERMEHNFSENLLLKDDGIKRELNIYQTKPMILISAGPSLDKQIPLLHEISRNHKFILGAVGTAIKPLIKNHIYPDFFSIIDPNPGTFKQLTGLSLDTTRLFYLSTAYNDTIKLHTGPRSIMWQKGFLKAEEKAEEANEPCIETGGSVATALLSLMTKLGTGPIALVGQDLAYTNGLSHATYSHAQKALVEDTKRLTTLDYYKKEEIATAKNLNIYRRWFEDFALKNRNLSLYNCTEGGAYINNWEHIKLEDFHKIYT